MHFIEKSPINRNPLVLRLEEDIEGDAGDDDHALNFSLHTDRYQELANGRCSVQFDDGQKYLYVSAIHVGGHTNQPTKNSPNPYVGLGQILVFAAIRFGFNLNLQDAKLIAVEGTNGFYLKMGFYPKISGITNRMREQENTVKSRNGRLNKDWLTAFENASYENKLFRGPTWVGNIPNLHVMLRNNILRDWLIIE